MSRLFSSSSVLGAAGSKMASFGKVTHCIFDMDGLLLDTEVLYTQVTQSIAEPYGKTYTWEIKQSIMGLQRDEAAEAIVAALELPLTPAEYVEVSNDLINRTMEQCQLMPDTEPIYERVLGDLLKRYSTAYPRTTRMKVMGTTEQRTCEILVNDLRVPCSVDEFLAQFRRNQLLHLGQAPLLQGAERLVRHLHRHNVPIALATSSGVDSVEVKTKNHRELFELFGHKVMGSSDPDVKEGKPAPDIFLVAASRFADSPPPDRCLVFEDAPNGVTAAIAAGMQAVMVPDPRVEEDQRKHATLVLRSLEDFQPEQFGLPPFST